MTQTNGYCNFENMLKVLLIGSGGREHAIALKLAKSNRLEKLFIAPGNPGTASLGTNIPIKQTDINGLVNFAKNENIDVTIVGPEDPLVLGIVDTFESNGLKIVGPSAAAAQLEGSKEWSKDKMIKYGIPTASFSSFSNYSEACAYIKKKNTYPIVIKADGLAAGKGVTVATNEAMALDAIKDCLLDKKFHSAGASVVIEDFLKGEEASIFAFTDGETVIPMVPAQDHKAIFDGDKGPNTGGMGAYSPTPIATKDIEIKVMEQVFIPLIKGLKKDGVKYKGIIYAGLMIENNNIAIVEFNARFGDPETQVVLPQLKTDILDIFEAITSETLHKINVEWKNTPTVCVVMASEGYPNDYSTGYEINGIKDADSLENTNVIHAGTMINDEKLVTNGGRVLAVVGQSETLEKAIESAYKGIKKITFKNAYYRNDIGQKAFKHLPT